MSRKSKRQRGRQFHRHFKVAHEPIIVDECPWWDELKENPEAEYVEPYEPPVALLPAWCETSLVPYPVMLLPEVVDGHKQLGDRSVPAL
jgi:hypothetical protein